jgi:putative pyruvate formate lyase activating enzyme
MDLEELVRAVERRRQQGARNVNLLGGEPTASLPGVLALLARVRSTTQVVLNSNMYYNDCVDDLLRGLIDVCLADLKCGNPRCAAPAEGGHRRHVAWTSGGRPSMRT